MDAHSSFLFVSFQFIIRRKTRFAENKCLPFDVLQKREAKPLQCLQQLRFAVISQKALGKGIFLSQKSSLSTLFRNVKFFAYELQDFYKTIQTAQANIIEKHLE